MILSDAIRKLVKAFLNPRVVGYLLNCQLQMAWRASVPLTVRLRGRIRVYGDGSLVIGERVILIGTVVPIELIAHPGARITIGDETVINYGTSISAHEQVTIGDRCKIGHYVFIMDNHQHDLLDRTKLPPSYPIAIENGAWIGSRATILPGVRIGQNSVVGAGSVVTRDVPRDTIVAGNPAKIVKSLPVSPVTHTQPCVAV